MSGKTDRLRAMLFVLTREVLRPCEWEAEIEKLATRNWRVKEALLKTRCKDTRLISAAVT